MDRSTSRIAFIASTEGGMDIEEVAARTPDKIITLTVDPAAGVQPHHGRRIAFALGLDLDLARQCQDLVERLYTVFQETDASLIEINPLVVTKQDNLICLDAKLNFDANALFRHPEIAGLRDASEEDPVELEASKRDLNYVKLDGEIGCLVNGAGLAMATMDIIKLYGSSPANFLDVGGGADKEKVTEAFKIILRDPNVKAILVNIFRRHHALRYYCRRRGGGGQGSQAFRAACGASGRHQCGTGAKNPGRFRPADPVRA